MVGTMLKTTDRIDLLDISQTTKDKLKSWGWTDIGMCIPQDEERFAMELTREQFTELCAEISRIRANEYWETIREVHGEKYLIPSS